MTEAFRDFWYPPDCSLRGIPRKIQTVNGVRIESLDLQPEHVTALARELKKAKDRLVAVPIRRIVRALDRVSRKFIKIDTVKKRQLVNAISAVTGSSFQMVERSIIHEMESSLEPDMKAALHNEFGSLTYLDRFSSNPFLMGKTVVISPKLVAGIVSSNIVALPHLTVMRSLLVKSPCLVKTSSLEPLFLPVYARALWEEDPDVGRAVAVISFPRVRTDLTLPLLSEADFVIVYGGVDTVRNIKKQLPSATKALFHSHKFGFCIVTREVLSKGKLEKIARRIAYDVVLFDQQACLSPHAAYVEGGFRRAEEFGKAVYEELLALCRVYPPPDLPIAKKLAMREEVDSLMLEDKARVFASSDLTKGVVIVQQLTKFKPSVLGRFLRVVPVDSVSTAVNMVKGLGDYLQNAAVAACPKRFEEVARQLAEIGVARICTPGNMGTPTMMWHHDGKACLAAMTTFSDIESDRYLRELYSLPRAVYISCRNRIDLAHRIATSALDFVWTRLGKGVHHNVLHRLASKK